MLGLFPPSDAFRWLRLRSALVPCSLAVVLAGCGSNRPALAGELLAPAVTARADADAPVTRLQKPDEAGAIRPTIFKAVSDPFPSVPAEQVSARIRAEVNGQAILDEDVREACLQYLKVARSDAEKVEIFRKQLDAIIDQEVVLQDLYARMAKRPQVLQKLKDAAAKEFEKQILSFKARAKLKTEAEVKAAMKEQGINYESFRRSFERQFMSQEYIRNRIWPHIEQIGHQQIVEYYEQHAAEFQADDRVDWQDIFVDAGKYRSREEARQVAQQVAAKAAAGADFAGLAAKYDNGISAYSHGEGLGHKRGEIKPLEVEPFVFQLKEGQVGPVVELSNGYHVVRVVHRDYAGTMPLNEKVQADIKKKLQNEVYDRETKRFLAELKRKASIEIAAD